MTVGYLTYDYFIQKYWVCDTSDLGKQMVWHHVMGILSIGVGACAGYALPGIICCQLLVEISTVFINFRSFYDKKDFGKMIPQICQVMFFLSFTLLRVLGMPYGLYLMYLDGKF